MDGRGSFSGEFNDQQTRGQAVHNDMKISGKLLARCLLSIGQQQLILCDLFNDE